MLELADKWSKGNAENGGDHQAQADEPLQVKRRSRLARFDAVTPKEVDEIGRSDVQVDMFQVEEH